MPLPLFMLTPREIRVALGDWLPKETTMDKTETETCTHRDAQLGCESCVKRVRAQYRDFPIQQEHDNPAPLCVPWAVADKAWAGYAARYGRSQSPERLAQRGGFAPSEMDAFFPGWREATDAWRNLARENDELRARVLALEADLREAIANGNRLERKRADEVMALMRDRDAARAKALDEAAAIADHARKHGSFGECACEDGPITAADVADDIRALKSR